MDTLTHTVLGACTGQIIAGKQIGKKAMLIGALINNFPDLDMIANLWHSPAESLLSHRGITHSFFFMILSIPVLIWLFRLIFPSAILSWTRWFFLIVHGLALHILLDACTTYGTGWFEPFSHYRVSFNTLFIIDPFFLLPLLLGAILLLILKSENQMRTKIAGTALSLSMLYLFATIVIKLYVDQTIQKELKEQNMPHDSYAGTPTPMNNLLWYILVKEPNACKAGYFSVLDKARVIRFESISQNDSLLNGFEKNSDVATLKQFSKGFYSIERLGGDTLCFSDLRFGPMTVTDISSQPAVFRFYIAPGKTDTAVAQMPFTKIKAEQFTSLYQRIKGQ